MQGKYSRFTSVSGIDLEVGKGWPPGSPVCYFPLDSDSVGSAHGNSPSSISFTPDGIHGNAFSFINPSGNLRAYYYLGTFPYPEHCYTAPDRCPWGMSISFWLNILAENQASLCQGFISTRQSETGPGFQVTWCNSDGLEFIVRRYSDSVTELITISPSNFKAHYGFANWMHYTMTYYFDGSELGNNMDVYVNSISRPASEKDFYFDTTNTDSNSGKLEISKHFLNGHAGDDTNMKLDDVIIWELKLPCHDVIQLYQAYQN